MFNHARSAMTTAAAGCGLALFVPLLPAQAQTVVGFDGTVVASCVLSVTTPGVLGVNLNSGTEISSEHTGGIPAVLSVTATAGIPTLSFSAPSLSVKPAAYTRTPTVNIKYTSTGGANQGYTSSASQYTSTNALSDTVTLHAQALDSAGFGAGTYRLQTTATCQQ